MATYHFSLKQGKVGKAEMHCDYINREGRYSHGEMKEELSYKETGNLPYWANTASEFFKYADAFERSNGNAYTEFEVALPAELSLEENIQLVQTLVKEHIGDNKVYSFAIHEKMAALDSSQKQPHAHIMFSERMITDFENVKYADKFFARVNNKNPEKGGYKKDERFTSSIANGSKNIKIIRKFWENKINEAYGNNGFDIKVSSDTLEKQRQYALLNGDAITAEELNRPAQVHLGPKLAGEMKRQLAKADFKVEMLSEKAQIAYIAKQLKAINEKVREREEYIEELRVEKEQQAVISAELKEEVKEKYVDIYGSNLIERIYEACSRMSKQLQTNNEKIEEIKKQYIRNDATIEKMVLSIYTKKATKKLDDELKDLNKQKTEFNKRVEEFNKKPEPKIFEFKARTEYNNEMKQLNKFREELVNKENEIKNKQAIIEKELAKPVHQERMETIRKTLYQKRDSSLEFISQLRDENKELSRIGKELLNTNRILSRKLHYEIPEKTDEILKKSSSITELQKALRDINRTANKLKDAKEQGRTGMKINLSKDENQNDNEGYDMGF